MSEAGRPQPGIWTQEMADHYRLGVKYGGEDLGVCSLCKSPMQIGDLYFLDSTKMMVEPTPPFHAECQGRGPQLVAERN